MLLLLYVLVDGVLFYKGDADVISIIQEDVCPHLIKKTTTSPNT